MLPEQTLSIVIPVYNEERTVHLILDKVKNVQLVGNLDKQLIIVNDCSSDDTRGAINRYMQANPQLNIQYFEHATNQGKGAALHTGIRHASGDFLIIQDADLEYNPVEYNVLLPPMLEGRADVVYGSRFREEAMQRTLFHWHSFGNRFLTLLSNFFSGVWLTDMETCYKLFRTDLIQSYKLHEKKFGFEPEVTAKIAATAGVRILETSISYERRSYGEGKKINYKDGFRAIYCILRYNLF